jgi:hypothetical protein
MQPTLTHKTLQNIGAQQGAEAATAFVALEEQCRVELPKQVIAGYLKSPTDVGMAMTAILQIGAASGSHGKSVPQTVLAVKPKAAQTSMDMRLTLI